DVLKYLADGLSSKQIAGKLNISINTINNHRKKMLLKTNCKSSAELISYTAKHGILHENK
ncbi:MAG TPA: LuxR C-terminal-related transcriptional regulator, partial [Chitinophagaceae bacterium]|nr:LuxR C-terminal-related transcriptional regulator [Chitinophagaceae bacterium]